jgi:lipopolysaccharide/colanic/teichoic acid biosynthesis glycosyltransferase
MLFTLLFLIVLISFFSEKAKNDLEQAQKTLTSCEKKLKYDNEIVDNLEFMLDWKWQRKCI